MILRTGKADVNVLDRSVRKRLGSVLSEAENEIGTASASVTFRTGHAGMLSVLEALNGLAAQGVRPETIRTDILLPPGSEESLLRRIEDEIGRVAEEAGVLVSGGHTEVTAAVTRAVVVTHACGRRCPGNACRRADPQNSPPGSALIQIGYGAAEGTFLLASERRKELEARFPVQMIGRCLSFGNGLLMTRAVELLEEQTHRNPDPCPIGLVNVSAGGIFAALWKLSEAAGCGFEVSLPDLALHQETIELCSCYDINPYQMESGGCLLAAADPACARGAVDRLISAGIPAWIPGRLTADRNRILFSGEERQSLNRPAPDALIPLLG